MVNQVAGAGVGADIVAFFKNYDAYVTTDYAMKYVTADRTTEGDGIATFVLVKDQGNWKIRHHHPAARRRPAGGL